jgi:tetratricopeptide (TPR) repeat protein
MRKIWGTGIAAGALVATAATAYFVAYPRREWTTESAEALEAYRVGREAQSKFYAADAARSYRRALELDPDFVAAQIGLMETAEDRERRMQAAEALRGVDRSRLNDRERLLVDSIVDVLDGRHEQRRARLAAYLAEHPDDPLALRMAAGDAWDRQDWERARAGYSRLLEADPSWVQARNNLGYIAMARGEFAEAEEQFRIYRYVAPDQANPHDSLGELLVLVGRYDEARAELERALAIRPDFCASYRNLGRVAIFDRRPEELEPIARRAAEHCAEREAAAARCMAVLGGALLTGDYDRAFGEAGRAACGEDLEAPDVLQHQLAVLSGRRELALEMEAKLRAKIEAAAAEVPGVEKRMDHGEANLLALLEGHRLLVEGRAAEAAEKLRGVDERSKFWEGNGGATLKLLAQLLLAEALQDAGDAAGAQRTLARLREVNPSFAAWFDTGPWRREAAERRLPG